MDKPLPKAYVKLQTGIEKVVDASWRPSFSCAQTVLDFPDAQEVISVLIPELIQESKESIKQSIESVLEDENVSERFDKLEQMTSVLKLKKWRPTSDAYDDFRPRELEEKNAHKNKLGEEVELAEKKLAELKDIVEANRKTIIGYETRVDLVKSAHIAKSS